MKITNMKRIVAAVVIVASLGVAGTALARGMRKQGGPCGGPMGPMAHPMEMGGWGHGPRPMPPAPWMGMGGCPCMMGLHRAPAPGRQGWHPEMRHGAPEPERHPERPAPRMERRAPQEGPRSMKEAPGMKRPRFSPDMPDEVRAKVVEAAKLRIDLEDVLSRRPLDRARAVELHKQIAGLEQEAEAWRFARRLDRIEEARKRGAPPRKKAPGAPEAEPHDKQEAAGE